MCNPWFEKISMEFHQYYCYKCTVLCNVLCIMECSKAEYFLLFKGPLETTVIVSWTNDIYVPIFINTNKMPHCSQ